MQVNQEAASQTDEKSIEIPNKRDTSPQKKNKLLMNLDQCDHCDINYDLYGKY